MSKQNEMALAVAEPNELAIPDEYLGEGLEGIDQDDLTMPRIRVIQPTSKLDGDPGTFHNNLTQATKKRIDAVLLRVTKSRVCWDSGDLAAPPVCASDDAITPRAEYEMVFAKTCASCPQARWGSDGVPPACRFTYNFLGADREDDDAPFVLSLSGASIKQAKRVISAFALKRKPLWSRPVTIQAVEVKNDKGRFYEVAIAPAQAARDFDWQTYRGLYLALRGETIVADTAPTEGTDIPHIDDDEEMPF